MDCYDDRDTISVPTGQVPRRAPTRAEPVVGLRIHNTSRELSLPLEGERFTLGGSSRCDLVIDDPYVSGMHCVLERRTGARMVVRDRRSKNGTFVNGNRIEVAELGPGGLITVGKTTLVALAQRSFRTLTAYERLRGEEPCFRRAIDLAMRAASSECSVLIVGETGTGKELVAQAIHDASPRAAGPFMAVNCGAIPGELVESELFGHVKGAFTGAVGDREGVFMHADGGTLFLDELGELPQAQQPHLLRVLETRMVRRVGDTFERAVDVRLVAATNQLALGTERSPLRLDLYHRVATVVVELPPLRQRRGDIPTLVTAFMDELADQFGRRRISRSTLSALVEYPWPGNVRELRHAVHRAVALSTDELSLDTLLPPRHRGSILAPPADPQTANVLRLSSHALAREAPGVADPEDLCRFDAALRDLIQDAYQRHGSIRRAAAALGIPKSTFADRARRYGIKTG